jgi:hypothetical protein
MSTVFAVNYMGLWEKMNNLDFNLTGFSEVKLNSTAITQMKSLVSASQTRRLT